MATDDRIRMATDSKAPMEELAAIDRPGGREALLSLCEGVLCGGEATRDAVRVAGVLKAILGGGWLLVSPDEFSRFPEVLLDEIARARAAARRGGP